MNILHTTESYFPEVSGMAEVVKQLSEGLVKLGHNVTVATAKNPRRKNKKIINGVHIAEFDISGKMALRISGDTKKYQEYLMDSSFDIITNFAGQQWATDLSLPILPEIKAKKVLVPTGFSGLYSPIYRNYYKKMKTWMKEYDMNIFLSNNYRDIDFAKDNKVRNIKVVPNGASKKEFSTKSKMDIRKTLGIPVNNFLVLNVSSHTGMKGHAEAIKIFSKAGLKNATFLLIGKKTKSLRGCYNQCLLMKSLAGKNVLIKDLTREETVAAFQAADIFLFTSRVECSPIVLFETIAAETPFLTTDVGNAKEIIKWTKGGILLPTKINKSGYSKASINESANILRECYGNRTKLSSMGRKGYRAWLERFTWEKIAKEYETLYESLFK